MARTFGITGLKTWRLQLIMRVGVTISIQASTFSGGVNTTAMHLALLLQKLEKDVYLVNNTQNEWFDDNRLLESAFKVCKHEDILAGRCEPFDILIEVAWSIAPELRVCMAKANIVVIRKPPLMYDMEYSVYAVKLGNNRAERVAAIWCIGESFTNDDKEYMQFLYSGIPVEFLPFFWYPDIVDNYVKTTLKPPETGEWEMHVCESNQSITSNLLLPISIYADYCRQQTTKLQLKVHSSDHLKTVGFFMSNVHKSLLGADTADVLLPRMPLPAMHKSRSFIVCHNRFAGVRALHIDALWIGIPLIHNIKELAGYGYYYPENNIAAAVNQIERIIADYKEINEKVS